MTGLSFAEPIGYHPSRSLSKQSESAPRLDNSFDKRQVAEHGQRSYKLGESTVEFLVTRKHHFPAPQIPPLAFPSFPPSLL